MRHFHLLFALSSPNAAESFQASQVEPTHSAGKVRKLFSALNMNNDGRPNEAHISTRRQTLLSVFGAGATAAFARKAQALDMDAFMNSELENDTKNCDPKKDSKCIPKLSGDEALCKYGQSGEARGEACKRVKKAGGALPDPKAQGKSLGGAYAM